MMEFGLILVIGLITGVLSGLLGIGGGAVLVPMMVFILGVSQHVAQGISMLVIIPTALVGVYVLHKEKLINYRAAMFLVLGSTIGALVSANFVQNVPADILKKLFGFFVIYSGFKMIVAKPKK